jgi:hypothetical protein
MPALAVFAPAVELPQVEVARPEVVVDDVDDDGQPATMGLFDKVLNASGPP